MHSTFSSRVKQSVSRKETNENKYDYNRRCFEDEKGFHAHRENLPQRINNQGRRG